MKRINLVGAGAFVLACSGVATAGTTIELGGGWQATIVQNALVDVSVDFVSVQDDILVIEKFANFTSLDALDVIFTQVGSDAETVSRIAIADELIFNNSGSDWTSYKNILTGDAVWNVGETAGLSISPFSTLDFSAGDTVMTFTDGLVLAGDRYSPGLASGAMVIDIDLSGDVASFTLTEMPVPAPGAAGLIAIAMLGGRRRRR